MLKWSDLSWSVAKVPKFHSQVSSNNTDAGPLISLIPAVPGADTCGGFCAGRHGGGGCGLQYGKGQRRAND